MHSNIIDKWRELGASGSFLGNPTGSEGVCPDGIGHYAHFDGGSIHWHPSHGAQATWGEVLEEWARSGWERGSFGYPVQDVRDVGASEYLFGLMGACDDGSASLSAEKVAEMGRFENGSILVHYSGQLQLRWTDGNIKIKEGNLLRKVLSVFHGDTPAL